MTSDSAGKLFAQSIADTAGYSAAQYCFEGASPDEATEKIAKYISDNPDMVAAFGSVITSAQAWAGAMEKSGRTDIVTVCSYCTENNLSLLKEDKIDALVSISYYDSAYESARTLSALLDGATYSGSEDEWLRPVDNYLVTLDGEGKNGVAYYEDIYARAQQLFS